MFKHRKLKMVTAVAVLATMILQPFMTWAAGTPTAGAAWPEPAVKIAPATATVDTSSLPPNLAAAENGAVWRLFDNDTTTAYTPTQPVRVTVTLPAQTSIASIGFYGSSSYQVNVYRDNAGAWEPVSSLSGKSLTALSGNTWNTLRPDAPFQASQVLLEFIPEGNVTAGIAEVGIWGSDSSATDNTSHVTLEGIRTSQQALDILAKRASHIFTIAATPSEISIPDGSADNSSAFASIVINQNPSLFKRTYLVYDGYNILRPVSIQKRINNGSWSGGLVVPLSADSTPSWASQVEEINPAWLIQAENRLELRSPSGTAAIRNLKLLVETDSGWNSVASVSGPAVYDGDTSTSFGIHASGSNPDLQVNFERNVEPDKILLHVSGPVRLHASLQYLRGEVWQDVKAGWQLDLSTLRAGWNEVALPAQVATNGLRLVFDTRSLRLKTGVPSGSINEIRVSASPVGTLSNHPRIVVSYPRDGEFFGRTAHIQGFATPAANDAGSASVSVEGKGSATTDGAFSVTLTKDETGYYADPDDTAWAAHAMTEYAGQAGVSHAISLDRNFNAGVTPPKEESRSNASFADNRVKYTENVAPGQAKKIVCDGVTLDIPEGAVDQDTEITVIPLTEVDLARLDPGMVNVTSPAAGYRFLPHGMKFKKPIKISFGYSKSLFAAGQTDNDVTMFYYNESLLRWQQLSRVNVDTSNAKVVSESDHFTDIINSTLVVPEHPQALSFNPNSIKDIKAADPSANVNLIEPPKVNNKGTANLSYPIEVPAGRNKIQPNVAVQYNSAGGNGWMGLGWDIPTQAISIDTRWGVPRYDPANETETYTLDGEQLAPVAHRGELQPRTEDKVFHTRVEGQFRKIIRHGSRPNNYWWEVIDKNGTKYLYGGIPDGEKIPHSDATLADPATGNVFKWALRQVTDTNGNSMNYSYVVINDMGLPGGKVEGRQIYLKKIDYTGHKDEPGKYTVVFNRDRDMYQDIPTFEQQKRVDVGIDARSGFKVVTADVLRNIQIYFGGSYRDGDLIGGNLIGGNVFGGNLVRRYEFKYNENPYGDNRPGTAFNKTLLTSVSQYGSGNNGVLFNTHQFTYFDKARDAAGKYYGFVSSTDWGVGDDSVSNGLIGKGGVASALGGNSSKGGGGHIYLGVGPAGNTSSKENTGGIKVGFNLSESESLLTMADMDGDGLPDKVFKDDGGFFYRKNLSGPGGRTAFSDRVRLNGLSAISHEEVTSVTFPTLPLGGEEYFGPPVLTDTNKSTTTADTYLADVNGDGLTDLVSGGQVLFGYLNAQGVPTFSANSADTPVQIGSRTIDTNGLLEDPSAEEAERAANFPLLDTVRRWVAPYDGTVRIDAPVAARPGHQ